MFLLQATVAHRFSYGILRFDLLYLLAAYVALEANPRGALVSALLIGLLRDMGSTGAMGANALIMALAAWGLTAVRSHVARELILADAMLVFLFALFCGGVEAGGIALFNGSAQWGSLMGQAFGQAALTAVLCPLLFAAYRRIGLVDRPRAAQAR